MALAFDHEVEVTGGVGSSAAFVEDAHLCLEGITNLLILTYSLDIELHDEIRQKCDGVLRSSLRFGSAACDIGYGCNSLEMVRGRTGKRRIL